MFQCSRVPAFQCSRVREFKVPNLNLAPELWTRTLEPWNSGTLELWNPGTLVHSFLSATAGSTFDARRAGNQTPTKATAASNKGTVANTSGSRGVTPNSKLAITRVRP